SAGDIEIEDDAAVRAGPADDVQPEPSAIDVSQAAQPEPVAIDAVAPATQVEAEPEAEPEPVSALEALPDVAPMDESAPSATGTDAEPPIEAPPIAAPTTVAELVAATLRAAGVRLAFTVPGESFLPLLEALERADIRVVATRHEGAAAFAAEAYGQLTGRPAVCLGTRAVGAANLAIGIHTARADSAPMFVLVGQVPRAVRGREAFQEVDLVDTIGRLASWAVQIDDAGTAADLLGEAANRVLGGRPGPVLVALPEDVLDEPLPDGTRVPQVRPVPPRPEVDEVRRVLHALAGARRPVILAGGGVLRARCSNDLTRLAELLHVPVIASWRRADVMSNDHPLYLGMAGYFAAPTVRSRLDDADLVVVLGSRLNEITTFGYQVPRAGQRWIHVDVEPQRDAVGDRPAPEMVVEADAKAFVKAALTRLRSAVLLAEPLLARDTANAEDRAAWETAGSVDGGTWKGPGVHPGRVIATLRRVLADDGIVTTDAGNFGGWAARGFRFRRPGTFLGPTSGAMGYGLPAAIAASLAHRDRHVVALVGDGGLGMTLAEIETAVREHARVVVLVFDNERYGTIRMHQERRASGSAAATDLGPVDFAAIARACGARGVRVETDEAFEPQLRSALVSDRPTVLQLVLDRRWVSVDDRPAIEAAPPAG
ncbi:MAG: thiamine pyrophosphate-dependent enzyme, partial [Chloroflexota bacterium]